MQRLGQMTARTVDQYMSTVIEPVINLDRNTIIQAIGVPAQCEIALVSASLEIFAGNTDGVFAH